MKKAVACPRRHAPLADALAPAVIIVAAVVLLVLLVVLLLLLGVVAVVVLLVLLLLLLLLLVVVLLLLLLALPWLVPLGRVAAVELSTLAAGLGAMAAALPAVVFLWLLGPPASGAAGSGAGAGAAGSGAGAGAGAVKLNAGALARGPTTGTVTGRGDGDELARSSCCGGLVTWTGGEEGVGGGPATAIAGLGPGAGGSERWVMAVIMVGGKTWAGEGAMVTLGYGTGGAPA